MDFNPWAPNAPSATPKNPRIPEINKGRKLEFLDGITLKPETFPSE